MAAIGVQKLASSPANVEVNAKGTTLCDNVKDSMSIALSISVGLCCSYRHKPDLLLECVYMHILFPRILTEKIKQYVFNILCDP